jgi:hypothetical protein
MNNLIDYLNRNEKKVLIFLFLITILFRSIYVYLTYKNTLTFHWSDDIIYLSCGKQIANGDWTPVYEDGRNVGIGPVIPFLVALFTKLFSNPILPMFIYNILVTSIVVIILFFLGKEVFSRRIGWLFALWGMFYMDYFKYTPHVIKEPTLFLFLPLTLYLLIKSVKNNNNIKYLILSSLTFILLIHCDERFFIYYPIFAFCFFIVKPFNLKKATIASLIWVGLVITFMIPWTLHNYKTFGQVVILTPRTTAITSKLWGSAIIETHFSNNEKRIAEYNSRLNLKNNEPIKKLTKSPYQYQGFELYKKAFINYWQPVFFNLTFIQYGSRIQMWSLKHNLLSLIFYGIFLPFYMIGLFLLIKKSHFIGLYIGIIPLIHSLLHTYMVWPLERYRSPVTFIVVLIGLWSIFHLHEIIKKRISQKSSNRMK